MIGKLVGLALLFWGFCPHFLQAQTESTPPVYQVHRICVDPGLGGSESGTVINDPPLVEKDLNLIIAQKVVDRLSREEGMALFLTRTSDVDKTWDERMAWADDHQCDLFVSIDCGTTSTSIVPGIVIKIPNFETLSAPTMIARETGSSLPFIVRDLSLRAHRARSYLFADAMSLRLRGGLREPIQSIYQFDYHGFGRLDMAGVWIELNMMKDPEKAGKLADPKWQDQIARAIAAGILDYKKKIEGTLVAPTTTAEPITLNDKNSDAK